MNLKILTKKQKMKRKIPDEPDLSLKQRRVGELKNSWLAIPAILWANSIFENHELQIYILQHLQDAFKPEFIKDVLSHFDKKPEWREFLENIDAKVRKRAVEEFYSVILREAAATDSAFLYSLSNIPKIDQDKDTWDKNRRAKWRNNHNYGLKYRDYKEDVARVREQTIIDRLNALNRLCNFDKLYSWQDLTRDINDAEKLYRIVVDEDQSYQTEEDKDITALILLNDRFEHVGHVYAWINAYDANELVVQGIRTPLFNYILGKCSSPLATRKVAEQMIDVMKQWAIQNHLRRVRIFGPVGIMRTIAYKNGFKPMDPDDFLSDPVWTTTST
jgi:hypothetical protein